MAVKLLLDAARGLAYMHEAGICHADVKSRNLLLFEEEEGGGEEAAAPDKEEEEQGEGQEGEAGPQMEAPAAAAGAGAGLEGAAAAAGAGAGGEGEEGQEGKATTCQGEPLVEEPEDAAAEEEGAKERVWVLKWCDFGISFVAKDMPGGVCKQVRGVGGGWGGGGGRD
jgi:serine/threonine protein kinase